MLWRSSRNSGYESGLVFNLYGDILFNSGMAIDSDVAGTDSDAGATETDESDDVEDETDASEAWDEEEGEEERRSPGIWGDDDDDDLDKNAAEDEDSEHCGSSKLPTSSAPSLKH